MAAAPGDPPSPGPTSGEGEEPTGLPDATPVSPGLLTGLCDKQRPSVTFEQTPWQQKRLPLDRVHKFATGRQVTVAVVDTGVSVANPQLTGTADPAMTPARFVPVDDDTVPATGDCDGHGTFVAGIIAARRFDDLPFVGVAEHARLLPVKVTEASDTGSADDLAAGIVYAVDQGADIINVSVVTGSPRGTLRSAVRYALDKGVVVVVAAGNTGDQGNTKQWPAEFAREKGFEGLIVVGALDEAGKVTSFTTTSVPISVVAPGKGVVSTAPLRGHTPPNFEGTSFAAPFVSGVAALILQAYDKKLTPVQVKRRIELTADHPGRDLPDPSFGWGVVNPYEAVTAILSDETARPTPSRGPAIDPIAAPPPPDDTARNVALGVAGGAVLVALFTLGGVATVRRGRERGWQPS